MNPDELAFESRDKGRQSEEAESRLAGADSKKYLFDNPGNVKILLRSFFLSLFVLLAVEPFVHKHAAFDWETWPAFYAAFGFVACVILVVAAKYILRPLVKRREDYYD